MSERPSVDPRAAYEYIWSMCQTCGDGVYVLSKQGVECDRCSGVAGIAGALPPIPYLPAATEDGAQ